MPAPKALQDKTVFIGETFGHWTILDVVDFSHVLVSCDCGSDPRVIKLTSIRTGRSKRCANCSGKTHTTHGEAKTKLYYVWYSMRNRCKNPKNKSYANYGGSGIAVCAEWDTSFIEFREWSIQNGYSDGLQIDRINNKSSYSPDNCRWVSRKSNANNKSNNVTVEMDNGAIVGMFELSEISGISPRLIAKRLRCGWSVEKSLLPSGAIDTTYKPKLFAINGKNYTAEDISIQTGLTKRCIFQRYNRRQRIEDIFKKSDWNRHSKNENDAINAKIDCAVKYFYKDDIV